MAFSSPSGTSGNDELNLELIRERLSVQDNVIFYNLLARSELAYNPESYSQEACKVFGFSGTLVEFIMKEAEKAYARAGRYKHHGELPFFGETLLGPVLPLFEHPEVLHPYIGSINFNKIIWEIYFSKMLPKLVKAGSDCDSSSSAVCDTIILQCLSRRVHYSMFLAEAKFEESPELFESAILEQDVEKLRKVITNAELQESNCRKENRAKVFGLFEDQSDSQKFKVKLRCATQLFDKYILPLIVEVQVQYLLLKGRDANSSSRAVRNIIRLRALSKTTQLLVTAGPSLAYFAKIAAILTVVVMVSAKEKIVEVLNRIGLMPGKAALALLVICFVYGKGAYDTLKKGKEFAEIAKYYAKLLEKDKKEP